MHEPVLSTYKILKDKAFNADIDETWVAWAIEMMQAGYEFNSLYELAGMSKPYNQFELQELTNKVLKDLQLDYSDKRKTLRNYTYFLIASNIDKPEKYEKILKEFRDIYYELDMDSEFQDFVLLYWAKDDLNYDQYQHYWIGANKTNIDEIIRGEFVKYLNKLDTEK